MLGIVIRGSEKPWIVIRRSENQEFMALQSQFPVWRPAPQILATKGHWVQHDNKLRELRII